MSVHKSNTDITKSSPGPRKAPVPQVDREHSAEMRRLKENPSHIQDQFRGGLKDPVRSEKK